MQKLFAFRHFPSSHFNLSATASGRPFHLLPKDSSRVEDEIIAQEEPEDNTNQKATVEAPTDNSDGPSLIDTSISKGMDNDCPLGDCIKKCIFLFRRK